MRGIGVAALAIVCAMSAWCGAVAQTQYGAARPYGTLRYSSGRRATRIPPPPPAAIPFDATVHDTPKVGVSPPLSMMGEPGIRQGKRLGGKVGARSGDAFAQRLGGGSPGVPEANLDPRDKLESKRTNYDRPQ